MRVNKLIISVFIIIEILLTAGLGQTKRELDLRLILPKDTVWRSSGKDCRTEYYFYKNGTYRYSVFCKDNIPDETETGTWHTADKLFFRNGKN